MTTRFKTKAQVLMTILVATVVFPAISAVKAMAATESSESESVVQEVEALVPASVQMVDDAIQVLSQGWSGMDAAERESFQRLFDPGQTGDIDERFVRDTLDNFRRIRSRLDGPLTVKVVDGSEMCELRRLFYTDLLTIYVCPYFTSETSDDRKARVLIHEVAHMALFVVDRPYYDPKSHSASYNALTPRGSWTAQIPVLGPIFREISRSDTLFHPDAYSWFAAEQSRLQQVEAPSIHEHVGGATLSQEGETTYETLPSKVVDDPRHERILAATVLITMVTPEGQETAAVADEALPIPNDEYRPIAKPQSYTAADGLGTLVRRAGELLILTHDHWTVLDRQLGNVQIRDGRGQLLAEMDMFRFKELIQYRDGGTMVLAAPSGMAARMEAQTLPLPPLSVDLPDLAAGDVVQLATRQRDGEAWVSVMEAVVESLGQKQGRSTLRLRSTDGTAVVGGDSGGGIWLDGDLIANTWTTIMMEDVQTGERRSTASFIAARMGDELAEQS